RRGRGPGNGGWRGGGRPVRRSAGERPPVVRGRLSARGGAGPGGDVRDAMTTRRRGAGGGAPGEWGTEGRSPPPHPSPARAVAAYALERVEASADFADVALEGALAIR